MARPREFDEQVVLEKVLSVFWERGYDGTSVEDLVEETGLGRASLYGAFGDKEQLFARALALYVSRPGMLACELSEVGSVREVIERGLRKWVARTCAKKGRRGCFLLLMGTGGGSAPLAREALFQWAAQLERKLAGLIARGQACGEIAPDRDPTTLARLVVVVAQGIASSARAGWSHDRLQCVVSELLQQLFVDARDVPSARRKANRP
jgi:TetR/AcrR family transcriptional repressor of nem operon